MSTRPGERPDWVPSWWAANRVNRWTWARPARMLGFYAVMVALCAGVLAWAAIAPGSFFDGPRSVTAIVGAVVFLAFAVVWVPRTARAWREERRSGG